MRVNHKTTHTRTQTQTLRRTRETHVGFGIATVQRGAKCRTCPFVPFACRRPDDCEKSINPNWKKLGKKERTKRKNVDGEQQPYKLESVCVCVCVAYKTIIRLRRGRGEEEEQRVDEYELSNSNSDRRRQRQLQRSVLLASQMVGYIEIHIAYRASRTNNI